MLQVDPGLLSPDLIHIDKVWPDVVDHSIEGHTILPALAKVFNLKAIFPGKVRDIRKWLDYSCPPYIYYNDVGRFHTKLCL